jgi:hypothetical protein
MMTFQDAQCFAEEVNLTESLGLLGFQAVDEDG